MSHQKNKEKKKRSIMLLWLSQISSVQEMRLILLYIQIFIRFKLECINLVTLVIPGSFFLSWTHTTLSPHILNPRSLSTNNIVAQATYLWRHSPWSTRLHFQIISKLINIQKLKHESNLSYYPTIQPRKHVEELLLSLLLGMYSLIKLLSLNNDLKKIGYIFSDNFFILSWGRKKRKRKKKQQLVLSSLCTLYQTIISIPYTTTLTKINLYLLPSK